MIPYVLRPIRLADLDYLKALTARMDDPIASLPDDRDLLCERIKLSLKSFAKKAEKPAKEYYLFALEHIPSGKVIGVSAIEASVGGGSYFFVYEIQKESFIHAPLNVSKTVDVLTFKTMKKGPSELCSLYLDPKYRVHGLGALLSSARYFFINTFPNRFGHEIIANLKGDRDEGNDSPFWKAIGDVFFGGNLATVDTMKSLGHKSFIRDLMPRHPIYIPLLPLNAQAVIGVVHPKTKPALHLLEKQGFNTGKWVDIFDAGPFAIANREDIKMIQNIRHAVVGEIIDPNNETATSSFLIANNSMDFRSCMGELIERPDGTVALDTDLAEALNIKQGSEVSYVRS